MRIFRYLLILAVAIGLTACGYDKFKTYTGPKVHEIHVHKGDRKMYLLSNGKAIKHYNIGLGFQPVGHKQFEGDGKTPEGTYWINYKNPNSEFHLSLKVNYPNRQDRAFAAAQGRSPGGDIFIHGEANRPGAPRDWTAGCIAVTDKEMEEIYSMIEVGTVIHIFP